MSNENTSPTFEITADVFLVGVHSLSRFPV
jgi:hypothetical protein